MKAYESEIKRAQREQEVAEAAKKEAQLVLVHLEEFPPIRPQRVPEPALVDRRAMLKDLTRQATSGIPWYKLSERRATKQKATEQAEEAIRKEEQRRAAAQAEEQMRLDASWRKLLNNDPQTVLAIMEEAFEDNQAPAAPINCEGDEVTIMMLYESPELIPDRKPALTPTGKPTLRKRTKTERNELYAQSMASNVLATAKEAFAVAPSINKVAVMVVRKDEASYLTQPRFSCLYCGRFQRSRFGQLNWNQVDPLVEVSNTSDALIERKGRTAEIALLDISEDQDLAAVLQGAAEGLGGEANIKAGNTEHRSSSRTDTENRHKKASEQQRSIGGQKEDTMMRGHMQKHTISVGTETIGETISFTAKLLGTAQVNGGKEAESKEGMDWTYYRLADHTYRVLIDNGSTSMLLPSNMAEALNRGEPVEYGRWSLEELQAEGEYGRVFALLMEKHPEGEKRNVRDLD